MVRIASKKLTSIAIKNTQPLSHPEVPKFFSLGKSSVVGQAQNTDRLADFQPRWWGNIQHQVR